MSYIILVAICTSLEFESQLTAIASSEEPNAQLNKAGFLHVDSVFSSPLQEYRNKVMVSTRAGNPNLAVH